MDLENIFRLSCCCPKVAYVRVCVCSHVYCLVTCWYPDLNFEYRGIESLQHTATYCNTLQHTATHCNTLQHTATHCNTLQHNVISSVCPVLVSSTRHSIECQVCCFVVDWRSVLYCRVRFMSFACLVANDSAAFANCSRLQHTATLQHNATHYTTMSCRLCVVSLS